MKTTLNIQGRLYSLEKPLLMAVINLTPDSFYAGSRSQESDLLLRAEAMLKAGADILDVGGYSTRPGAAFVEQEEERRRVLPALALLRKHFPEAVLSVDTFRAAVAQEAVAVGAGIVNDVSGGTLDAAMFETVAALQVPYILMHLKGTPQNMAQMNQYENIFVEIIDFFQKKTYLLKNLGLKDVILDPGLGFAKDIRQNYLILKHLPYFRAMGYPLLLGLSRKSMIYRTLGKSPEEALNGSTALHAWALAQGASILRVHDVAEAKEVLALYEALQEAAP